MIQYCKLCNFAISKYYFREDLSTLERPKREELEGSTLAPNFPKIIIKKPKDMNGPFYFDDVPVIRFINLIK